MRIVRRNVINGPHNGQEILVPDKSKTCKLSKITGYSKKNHEYEYHLYELDTNDNFVYVGKE